MTKMHETHVFLAYGCVIFAVDLSFVAWRLPLRPAHKYVITAVFTLDLLQTGLL
jgi:hypothetical protein